jgi:hypothetical protein
MAGVLLILRLTALQFHTAWRRVNGEIIYGSVFSTTNYTVSEGPTEKSGPIPGRHSSYIKVVGENTEPQESGHKYGGN